MFCPVDITLVHLTAEVLSEEPILKWYKDAHLAKGKSVFLEQMKKFVEWLKNAEEGKQKLSSQVPLHFEMASAFFCQLEALMDFLRPGSPPVLAGKAIPVV